jgi:hypothetical protein
VLTSADLRYRALRDDRGDSIGPYFDSVTGLSWYQLGQGKQVTLTAMFKVPADLTSVDVVLPGFETVHKVPVQ